MAQEYVRPFEKRILRIAWEAQRENLGIVLVLALREYGIDEEVERFLERRPGADIDLIADYIISLAPPIEYVDED